MTFDIAAKKGLKKRFFIDDVEGQGSQHGATLFVHDDTTDVVFVEGATDSPEPTGREDIEMRLGMERIGGLADQIATLNEGLLMLCEKVKAQNGDDDFPWNSGVLLHGYEGTGKTMLLNELEHRSGAKKSIRIDRKQLLGTASKNDAVIQAAFNDALANQPSLVVIDNLEKIAASGDLALSSTIDSLCSGFDAIAGSSVLVVAATRNHTDIDSSLVAPGRFESPIELPVPDSAARIAIVRALLNRTTYSDDSIPESVGSRTHGFTGKDLGLVVRKAKKNTLRRLVKDREWVKVQSRSSSGESTDDTLVDGTTNSRLDTNAETQEPATLIVTMEDFDAALQEVRPTALREIILETPKVTWDDIGGSNAVKEQFDQVIGWPLLHSDVLASFDRENWQKGVLLYGPPGCSKTMTAQAVANTYGLNFIAVKGAELISMYVGESERAVREVFRKARAAAPSIIFFDEIDSIGSSRDSGGNSGLNVLTTLLNEMDGFEALKGVQVLAATNKPESLDPAILRPGRFDAHIYLGPPTGPARRDILTISTKGLTLKDDVDLAELEKTSEGYSGAEIVRVGELAIKEAIGRVIKGAADRSIGKEDFDKGFATTARGITAEMLEAYEAFAHRAARQ